MSLRRLAATALLACLASAARAAAPHPVVALIDEEYGFLGNENQPAWKRVHEDALDEIAASTQARSAGAREALDAEFVRGRLIAGGVLWKLTRDPRIVDRLLETLAGQTPASAEGVGEHAFVLGYARDPRAVPGLRAAAARFREEPLEEIFCARAIYLISRDAEALALIRRRARGADPRWESAEIPLSVVAKRVLDDLRPKKEGKP